MAGSINRRHFLAALTAGFVAVPALALATGLAWSDGDEGPEPSATGDEAVTTVATSTTSTTSEESSDLVGQVPDVDFQTALNEACGPAGMQLVDKETSEKISSLEQGVLDALREVCADNDMPLPAKPVPEPIEQVVVVQEVSDAPSASSGVGEPPADDEEPEDDSDDEEDDEEDDDEAEEDEEDD